jgi:molybdate transport system substrate-binding protein
MQHHARTGFVLILLVCCGAAQAMAQARVAAASSLAFVLPEIVSAFEARHGGAVELSYGASGLLTRQIQRGAPFELFLSADEHYVAILEQAGLTRDAGTVYARGELVLFVTDRGGIDPATRLDELPALHARGTLRRLALAHPEHAPYGIAARQALEASGAWHALQPALAIGESVAQAARFVTSGAAEAGLIAKSLALQPQVAARGRFSALPAGLYPPLNQRMVLLRDAGTTAEAFHAFLRSPEVRAILARHGFGVP